MPRRGRGLLRLGIGAALALADCVALGVTGLAAHAAYRSLATNPGSGLEPALHALLLVGVFLIVPTLARGEYSIESAFSGAPQLRRTASLWLAAWTGALIVGFLTKSTAEVSRVVALACFAAGLPAVVLARHLTASLVRRHITPRSISARRVHLVGYEADIASFHARHDASDLGVRVIGETILRAPDAAADANEVRAHLSEDLDLAVSVVRFLRPDDVFVLIPWGEVAPLEACIDAFLRVPVGLHLRPGRVMDRFGEIRVDRVGRLTGLRIGRPPLGPLEIAVKRSFDVVVALSALILLSPLLLLIAAVIRLDSPGPCLFRQRRHGFNQEAFSVFKFRSMRVAQDAVFRQATRNDDRITRVGRILRRTNLDELPQLLNVIRGDMSLVGPRPHALAHDRSFERRIARYARRHNVPPGITGWAQVNGLRGETLTDADMRRRVEHDLHYIDNWSLWFDIQIIVMTVLARSAFRNAY
ncbi:MAG: exopolysaccharide biosynthesis polyprenyl glycosylphosphotransferase [Methylobacterium frigidaeris]